MNKENKYRWYLSFIVMMILLMSMRIVFGGQSSPNYSIDIDVVSGGGGDSISGNYGLFSLAGQPSAIGTSSSSSYDNYAGFIWALVGLPAANLCEGDFDNDGDVDGSDLAIFAADFGRTNCSVSPPCEGDFDHEGDVDGSDLALFAADFGRTDCP